MLWAQPQEAALSNAARWQSSWQCPQLTTGRRLQGPMRNRAKALSLEKLHSQRGGTSENSSLSCFSPTGMAAVPLEHLQGRSRIQTHICPHHHHLQVAVTPW